MRCLLRWMGTSRIGVIVGDSQEMPWNVEGLAYTKHIKFSRTSVLEAGTGGGCPHKEMNSGSTFLTYHDFNYKCCFRFNRQMRNEFCVRKLSQLNLNSRLFAFPSRDLIIENIRQPTKRISLTLREISGNAALLLVILFVCFDFRALTCRLQGSK